MDWVDTARGWHCLDWCRIGGGERWRSVLEMFVGDGDEQNVLMIDVVGRY